MVDPNTPRLLIDDLAIDRARRKVYRDGTVIALSGLSYKTLDALIEAAPEPLTIDELIARAWNGTAVSDAAVTQRIRLLRQALGDDVKQPRYIETLRNEGYRLIPPVRTEQSETLAAGIAAPQPEEAISASKPRRRLTVVILAATFLCILTVVVAATKSPPKATMSVDIPTGPPTAAELAARARDLTLQRNPRSLAHAIELYEQALALAPDDANIQARFALALARSVAWYDEPPVIAHRAEALARQSLDQTGSFDGELALGLSLDAQGRVELARAAYERAVALNPDNWRARASLAYLMQVKGRLVEGLFHNFEALDRGAERRLDAQVGGCLRLLDFGVVASRWLERADRLDPSSAHAAPTRVRDMLARGDIDAAQRVVRAAPRPRRSASRTPMSSKY